jgi:hypothetical protein
MPASSAWELNAGGNPHGETSTSVLEHNPMERQFLLTFVAIVFSTMLFSSGCQKKTAATDANSQSKSELRDSTKPLQAADLVGYDGTKLRKSVDRMSEANDKHNQQIEKMAESPPDQ